MHQSPSGRWGLPYKQNVVGFNSHLVYVKFNWENVMAKSYKPRRVKLKNHDARL